MQFLHDAVELFKTWNLSGKRGLTKETFLACTQTIEAVLAVTDHLLVKHDFEYVLPGKFVSDPLEARFGWYRQASGGNFFISLKQLLQAEKKIRCLSLIQQRVLQGASRLPFDNSFIERVSKKNRNVEDTTILENVLSRLDLDNLSEADCCITYFVSGYIARSVSRRRKCQSCKELLIKNDELSSLDDFIFDKRITLLDLADRGGLAVPSDYCFAVCTLAVQAYEVLTSNADAKKILLQYRNQRCAFIQAVSNAIETSNLYLSFKNLYCEQNHQNFEILLQTAFNCFAKNELKRMNQSQREAPAKMKRTVRKLSAKTSKD